MEMIALIDGDTKNTWDTDNPEECTQARALFDDYRGKGFSAFRVENNVNIPMTEFDPSAGTVLFIPAMTGG